MKSLLNLNKLNSFLDNNKKVGTLLVFSFFLISFLITYMNLPILSSSDDHYFHFRFAERFLHDEFFNSFRDFKTIYFTNVANGEHLLYYNFLFYLVLVPYTFIVPLYLGIKLFAVMSVSLIGVAFYYCIKKIGIRYPFFWSVGFFAVIGMGTFWRLFLSRPFVLSPIIIVLLIFAIYKKKYLWIFILSFITLFWHTATFLFPLVVMIIYFFSYYFYMRKYLWKELLFVLLGTLSSVAIVLLIDKGFFVSIKDNLFSVLYSAIEIGDKPNISIGSEVYPKNLFDLFNQNIFLCSMFVFSVVLFGISFLKDIKNVVNLHIDIKNIKIITFTFFMLSAIFIVAINFISNRFTDFFIFFAWVFIILIINDLFHYLKFNNGKIKKCFKISVFVMLVYLFVNNNLLLNSFFAYNGSRPETFSEVGNYLSKNLKRSEIVFNVDWSWFPQLYYYAPEQNYVIGLEPKLTYLYNPRLYWLWQNIGKGYVCATEKCPEIEQKNSKEMRNRETIFPWIKEKGNNIADVIINDFQSRYIVTSSDYIQLNNVLNNSKRFEKVLNSKDKYFIYKVLP